jgi:hypothetical protein
MARSIGDSDPASSREAMTLTAASSPAWLSDG